MSELTNSLAEAFSLLTKNNGAINLSDALKVADIVAQASEALSTPVSTTHIISLKRSEYEANIKAARLEGAKELAEINKEGKANDALKVELDERDAAKAAVPETIEKAKFKTAGKVGTPKD